MLLSESFCEQNIDWILEMLKDPKCNQIIKNNLLIAFGDLLLKWPNILVARCKSLYANLVDSDYTVKKTTLNVIFHLIMNDMIKIKGEISYVAILLSDLDDNVRQQA